MAVLHARSEDGVVVGRWALLHQGGGEASLWHDWGSLGHTDDFVVRATAAARQRGWWIVARVDAQRWPGLCAAFRGAGWRLRARRVEWQHPLSALPALAAPRIRWVPAATLPPAAVHAVLGQAVRGDPLRPETGSPGDWLRGWMAAPGLVGAAEIGFEGTEAIAFSSGQASPDTGWCRIPYAGLIPAARMRGLGEAAIGEGIALMRAAGGEDWTDGCAADNVAVTAIISRWGVVPDSPLEEWIPPS